jgi:hypothetical protein
MWRFFVIVFISVFASADGYQALTPLRTPGLAGGCLEKNFKSITPVLQLAS